MGFRQQQVEHRLIKLLHVFSNASQRLGPFGLRLVFTGNFRQVRRVTQCLGLGQQVNLSRLPVRDRV